MKHEMTNKEYNEYVKTKNTQFKTFFKLFKSICIGRNNMRDRAFYFNYV